jgi:heterodisulfide reductase subunit D
VLGGEERCTGDVARRFGEEGLFQQLARYNIETLRRHRVRRIVATCPHCFNTLKNEYPQLGGDFFEVTDHNSFLAELIDSGRLQVQSGSIAPVTYHDPCYLGRHNDVYAPPRSVLESIGETKVLEMERNRDRAFCCGAGGGNYWFEVPREERCEGVRLEEARRTGARVLGVSCPFCLAMFNEAQKRGGERTEDLAVLDVAEILAEHVGKSPARA